MSGQSMTSFVPLHKSVFERSGTVRPWLEDILGDVDVTFVTPNGWYDATTQKEGTFVWTPAPAAAEVVVERLGVARHKRPNSLHVIVIPRLMTGRWRKHLLKATDFYCRLDCDALWDLKDQYEPLLMFVSLPFLPDRPNFEGKRDILERLRGLLLSEGVSQAHTAGHRDLLRKLLVEARTLCSV